MNIALIGSGGREHALCQKLTKSKKKTKIYCFPGNAGTAKIATNINIDFLNFNLLHKVLIKLKIQLVIVGPEQPLVKGIVDFLRKKKINVFGPTKYAAQLEGSKAFMKNLCKKNNIPTAKFKVCKNKNDVKKFLLNNTLPVVVKADGLAAGKGVKICKTKSDVIKISDEIFRGKFKSSKKLVLEEFLDGEEASYFLIVDKKKFLFFGTAQDHKRVGINDTGPNTGGMGAYSPAPLITKALEKKILDRIVRPTLLALKKKGNPYTGFLYTGLMIKNDNPYLIEYNVRMGDPECQVILPRLNSDLINIIKSSVENRIGQTKIKWLKKKCMTIVLCSKGYPNNYKKNIPIKKLKNLKIDKDCSIFHAGTSIKNGNIISVGGRVLNINALGTNYMLIRKKIIKIIKKINWSNGFYRPDIGRRVIKL